MYTLIRNDHEPFSTHLRHPRASVPGLVPAHPLVLFFPGIRQMFHVSPLRRKTLLPATPLCGSWRRLRPLLHVDIYTVKS